MCCCSVGRASAMFPSFQGPQTYRQKTRIWKGAIFPHLHKPSWKVYSLIPGPLRYKRAEDLGLFSLQSLSFLIRQIQTWGDNSRLGSVKERRRTKQIIKKKWRRKKAYGTGGGSKKSQDNVWKNKEMERERGKLLKHDDMMDYITFLIS